MAAPSFRPAFQPVTILHFHFRVATDGKCRCAAHYNGLPFGPARKESNLVFSGRLHTNVSIGLSYKAIDGNTGLTTEEQLSRICG